MDKELYDKFFELEGTHWWFQGRKEIVLTLIKKYVSIPRPRILDVGCGTGLMLKEFSKIGETIGVDNNTRAIAFSRIKNPSIRIESGELPRLKIEGGFDVITALDVIEHIENDAAAVKNIRELLRPNGFFVITVPAYQFLWSCHDILNHHKRRYTKNALIKKIESAGFKVEYASYFNTILFAPAAIYKFCFQSKRSSFLKEGHLSLPRPSLNRALTFFFRAEKFFLPYCSLPFGLSLVAVCRKNQLPLPSNRTG